MGGKRKLKNRPAHLRYRQVANTGFVPDQIRMWRTGFQERGPVRLWHLDEPASITTVGPAAKSHDTWRVEVLSTGELLTVPTQELSRVMSEMEVVAWAAR